MITGRNISGVNSYFWTQISVGVCNGRQILVKKLASKNNVLNEVTSLRTLFLINV